MNWLYNLLVGTCVAFAILLILLFIGCTVLCILDDMRHSKRGDTYVPSHWEHKP